MFSCAGGGRNTANKYHWCVWRVLTVSQLHWVCPHSRHVCFHGLHFSGSRLLCRELSEVGPELHALSMSKSLRFRFSGTPQRCRLSWACVLGPAQVRAAQVMRYLASEVAVTYCLPRPCRSVFWVHNQRTFSGRRQPSRIPSSLGEQ